MTGRLYYNKHRRKWQAIVELGHDPQSGKRQQIYRDAKTKAEARQVLQKLMRELEDGSHVEPHKLTVADYLRSYVAEHARHTCSARVIESMGYMVERHLVPALGAHKLQGLRPMHLQHYYSEKIDSGLSPTTVRKHHNTIHVMLRHAVRMQLLAVNPSDAVTPPRIVRKEMSFLDAEASAALLRKLEGGSLYLPVLLALGTGLRRGELLALRWSDIDLDAGTLIVARTLEEAFGTVNTKQPKTVKSRRRVTLPEIVVDALRAEKTKQAEKTLAREPGSPESDVLLRAASGDPWKPSAFDRKWRRFRRNNAVPVRFHDLRHSHASQLLAAGVHVKVVSERLGHASIAITLDTYSHVIPALQEEAAEKIDTGLRAALSS
jgi:integrase